MRFNTAFNVNAYEALEAAPQYISCAIPQQREPEFGAVLEDFQDYQSIYDNLCTQSDIRMLPVSMPPNKVLVSLAEDTVNEDGFPNSQVRALDLERRRRVSLMMHNASYQNFDISFKDAKKSDRRREWEAAAQCLQSGERDILKKLANDIPNATMLNPDSFRVSSICITSRADYSLLHVLEKEGAMVKYEICNDACVFSNPHADRILGFRKETEFEAKCIYVKDPKDQNAGRLNELLDTSLDQLKVVLGRTSFKGIALNASISKVNHANELVRMDYERNMPRTAGIADGREWALLQNVRAWEFIYPNRIDALVRLAQTLPPAKLLMPSVPTERLDPYFQDDHRYPLFPVPGLKC
jgi:hypothetical protein